MKLQTSRRSFLAGAALTTVGSALAERVKDYDVTYELFHSNKMTRPWLRVFQGIEETSTPRMVCDVEGDWPSELQGTFIRNGPGRLEFGKRRYQHWLDGDGLIQAWEITPSGRVIHRGRMVETTKFRFDQKRRELARIGFGSISNDGWSVLEPIALNVGNSNVLPWRNEFWALWEGGSPWRLDYKTLETLESVELSVESAGLRFGAHPRREPDGTLWNIGVDSAQHILVVWRFEPGKTKPSFRFTHIDPISIPHDFVVSERFLIVLVPPLHYRPSGKVEQSFIDAHVWEPDSNLRLRVLEKDDISKSFDLELPAQWFFHLTNAWEDKSGNIRFQGVRYPNADLLTKGYKAIMRGEVPREKLHSELVEIAVDTRSKRALINPIDIGANSCEYPVVDQRLMGTQHEWVTMVTHRGRVDAQQRAGLMNNVVRINLDSGRTAHHRYADNEVAEEHVYIPRFEGAGENDGWLLGTSLNFEDGRIHLNVLRVSDASMQHVARATLSQLMPLGLHGHFIPRN